VTADLLQVMCTNINIKYRIINILIVLFESDQFKIYLTFNLIIDATQCDSIDPDIYQVIQDYQSETAIKRQVNLKSNAEISAERLRKVT
jgi:hypothetical protein